MSLKDIYRPVKKELGAVEQVLKTSLKETRHSSILKVTSYLLGARGKRIRPALVILSTRASQRSTLRLRSGLMVSELEPSKADSQQLARIAAAVELIHTASLIHDDVIDHAALRHNQPTINSKWGEDVSIALGDYLYAEAFRLISDCGNSDIISCISSATKSMCEGELLQVCERDNLDLLKERYITIVKKKTAELFAASCHIGAMVSHSRESVQEAFRDYGLNFGIAFQITDDLLDLIADQRHLGKAPGADFKMGELTLPLLNLLAESKDKKKIMSLLTRQNRALEAFEDLRLRFIHSQAFARTKLDISSYLKKAKSRLGTLNYSPFKESLSSLADFIIRRIP